MKQQKTTDTTNCKPIHPDMVMLCLEAAWEIDVLARVLAGLVNEIEDHAQKYAVRGIAGRLLRLTSVQISALDNDSSHEQLAKVIHLHTGQG